MEIVVISEKTGQLYLLYLVKDWSATLYYYTTKIVLSYDGYIETLKNNNLTMVGFLWNLLKKTQNVQLVNLAG